MSRGYMCDSCGAFAAGQSNQRDGDSLPQGWADVRTPALKHLCESCVSALSLSTPPKQAYHA